MAVCRVIPNPGVGKLNLFISLLLCILNGNCSRRPDSLFVKSIPVILSLVRYLLGGKYFLEDAIMETLRMRA